MNYFTLAQNKKTPAAVTPAPKKTVKVCQGNVTGVTNLSVELVQKQVEMLHELVPTATVTAALLNPTFPGSESQSRDLQAAARKLGLEHVLHASTERDFEPIFAAMVQLRAGMLVIGAVPFFFGFTAIKSPPLQFVTGCLPYRRRCSPVPTR